VTNCRGVSLDIVDLLRDAFHGGRTTCRRLNRKSTSALGRKT
jgi:hypothetical protein